MKRILVVHAVVRIVIDAAQHQTFRQGTEEQVLVRVRPSARGNGVHLAVDGSHRVLDRALLESIDVRHLYDRIQGGLLCKQGGIDYVYPVIGVAPTSHERKRRLTAHADLLRTAHVATLLPDSSHSPVTEPCRCCRGGVVVRLHKVLMDVDVSLRLVFREVSPHACLQRSIESFNDARLRLRVYSEFRVLDLSATSLASLW